MHEHMPQMPKQHGGSSNAENHRIDLDYYPTTILLVGRISRSFFLMVLSDLLA